MRAVDVCYLVVKKWLQYGSCWSASPVHFPFIWADWVKTVHAALTCNNAVHFTDPRPHNSQQNYSHSASLALEIGRQVNHLDMAPRWTQPGHTSVVLWVSRCGFAIGHVSTSRHNSPVTVTDSLELPQRNLSADVTTRLLGCVRSSSSCVQNVTPCVCPHDSVSRRDSDQCPQHGDAG